MEYIIIIIIINKIRAKVLILVQINKIKNASFLSAIPRKSS